jgi:oryzin
VGCNKEPLTSPALWGLGRVSHQPFGPWNEYLYRNDLPFCSSGPKDKNVAAYVIDSGIYHQHDQFGGRASLIFKAQSSWDDYDNCGHGTHVAGTIAGRTYGIARNARVFGLKALDGRPGGNCGGTWQGVIAAIDHAHNDAKKKGNIQKSVINMSLGEVLSSSLPSPLFYFPAKLTGGR